MLPEDTTIEYKLGQVGGFPLRLSWLPRLVILENSCSFSNPETIARNMGIGINMVKALRIWARAVGIVDLNDALTKRAKCLFSRTKGVDKYAEKEETLWLLHWLICSNLQFFTANGWLLNFFHARTFTLAEALDAFSTHVDEHRKQKYARGTISVDLETAIRMYAVTDSRNKWSDIDDRCFRVMRLLLASRAGSELRYTRILRDEQPRLSSKIVVYTAIDAMSKRGASSSSFSDLYVADNMPAPGAVFGLTKDGFLTALEVAVADYPKILSMNAMPDGDFRVQLKGDYANLSASSKASAADDFYFGLKR